MALKVDDIPVIPYNDESSAKRRKQSDASSLMSDERTPLITKEGGSTRPRFNRGHLRLLFTAIAISLGGSLHAGLQLTAFNPTEKVFQDFINETYSDHYGEYLTESAFRVLWSLILNSIFVGCFLGSLPIVQLSESLGRRKCFYISASLILGGLIFEMLSKPAAAYELLPIGRFFIGFGTGVALPLQGMFFNEISPMHLRGFIGGLAGIMVETGYIAGGILGLPVVLGTETHWVYIFLLEAIPAAMLLPILPFVHESPRFLVSRKQLEAAKRSLEFYGHEDPKADIEEIQAEIRSQKNEIKWKELWQKRYLRRGILLSFALVVTAFISGIVLVDFFSTTILSEVGLSLATAQYASVGIFSGTVLASLFGQFFVERIGRRFLLLSTTSALIISNTALMIFSTVYRIYSVEWAGVASIVACCLMTLAVGGGPSILLWIVPSEMVPLNARSKVNFLVMIVHNLALGIVGFIFYPLEGVMGPYVFLIFIIPLIMFLIFFYFKFPETKSKTPMEVMRELGFQESTEF